MPCVGVCVGERRRRSGDNPFLFLAPLSGLLAFADRASGGAMANTLTGTGAVRYQAANGARINLAKNPSFETGTTFWSTTGTGTTMTRLTSGGARGAACLQIDTVDGATGFAGSYGGTAQNIAAFRAPVAHVISFDAKSLSGVANDCRVIVIGRDAAANAVGSATGYNFTVSANWQRFALVFTPAASGIYSCSIFFGRNTAIGAASFAIDGLVVEEGAAASPVPAYFDGSTGGVWLDPITGQLGTAHASPSVSQAVAWVEEGTTNTILDPSFENGSIATYWNVFGAATSAKVTTHAYIGSNGGHFTCTASTSDGVQQDPTTAGAAATGQAWTLSGRIRAYAVGDVGKTIVPGIRERTSSNVTVQTNSGSPITLTDAWQLFVFTVTLSGGATVAKAHALFTNGAAVACDFVLDAVQLEQKAYATSYCNGSIGTGYSWSGTAHASSSTRAATTEKVDETNRISPLQGALAVRFRRLIDTGAAQTLFDVGDGTAGTDRLTVRINAADKLEMGWTSNGAAETTIASAGSIAVNTWYWGYVEWSGTAVRLSLDNGADVTGTRNAPQGSLVTANDLAIGSLNTGSGQADCAIGPVLIASRALTTRQRAKLASLTQWDWRSLDTA